MIKITYEEIGNQTYAKIMGKSYREGTKVKKQKDIYLGRVVDKDNRVFFNKKDGMFSYDLETGERKPVSPLYLGGLINDHRKKPKTILDFGDAFFADALLREMHYDEVLESIDYGNKDTLWAMALYYILTPLANSHAQAWYEGSFAKIIYPNADLTPQRISRFLNALGKTEVSRAYFAAHISWLKKYICDDLAVIIDSTGLPNEIDMNLTQISNHNGKISKEARLISALQRDSSYPILFRLIPGNIVDVSTVKTTIATLDVYHVKTDFVLLDAGYISKDNMLALLQAHIDFVARLPEKNQSLYDDVLKKGLKHLRDFENLVNYNDRYLYIKQIECKIDEETAFAYLCYDVEASGDENHKAIKSAPKKKKSAIDMHHVFESSGLFIIISSLPYKSEDILTVYYLRQLVEQYYDLSKGLSKLTPLRVHTEQRIMGHLILSQIAATVNLYIQKNMKSKKENSLDIFLGLRNQKCLVYDTRIIINEGQSKATKYYKKFKIKHPVSYDTSRGKLRAVYGL